MATRMTAGALMGVLLLALPASAAAQRPQAERMGGRMLEENPVQMLLEARERLTLTEEQVTKLTAIAAKLDEDNAPELTELREARAQMPARGEGRPTAEQRERMRAMMEQNRPLVEKVRERNRAALEEARPLLTEAQQATLREIIREQRPERRRPPRERVRG